MELNSEQIEFLNECTEGKWTLNEKTGLVDIKGDLNVSIRKKTEYCVWSRKRIVLCKGLTDFKGVKFGVVTGDFNCHDNSLASLVGAPREVGGSFRCHDNDLTSLKGAPQKVGGNFYCGCNNLTSLKGAPQKVGEDFACSNNKLTSLVGAPQEVKGNFSCSYNNLTSLDGAPQEVGGSFDCSHNRLTSLERAPQEVGGEFVSWNNEIPEWLSQRIYVIMKNRVNLRIGLALLKKEILDAKQKEIDSINSKYDTFLIEDEDLVKGVSMLNNFGHFD